MMRSLRSRLLVGTAVAGAAVLSASSVALFLLVRTWLWKESDAALAAKAWTVAALVDWEADGIGFESRNLNMPEFSRSKEPEYFQVWLADGQVLARSESLSSRDLEKITGPLGTPVYRPAPLPDGRSGHMVGITFYPRDEVHDREGSGPRRTRPALTTTLVLARDTAPIDRQLNYLKAFLLVVWGASILVMVGVLTFVVRTGLEPAAALARRIAQTDADNLASNIQIVDAPTELVPVVDRLNELLSRLEKAFQRERSFASDAAHELRTPLAGLQSIIEVSLGENADPSQYKEALSDCLVVTEQMKAMVNALLMLAKAESGQLRIQREPVDVSGMLAECWRLVEERAASQCLKLDWQVPRDLSLNTDPEKLRIVFRSLLDNVVTHSNINGQVWINGGTTNGRARIVVRNTGSRVPAENAHKVFDRFWRGDGGRPDTGLHCGLGLALVKNIMTLLGGAIRAESSAGGDFVVTLEFHHA